MKRVAVAMLALGFTWLSACSVLVDPDSLVIKCEVVPGRETDDPCLASGMHCVGSECKPCEGAVEICNGVDDDCDGVIDNGHDEDNDGFTWCGGGRPEFADCAPNDPTIHPAGELGPDGSMVQASPELCDGKDNDCDSKVDEAPECSAMHSCVSDGCMMGQRCDPTTGVCIEPRPVGSGCQLDSECAGGFCLKKGDYGLGVVLNDNRCASACCTDGDCISGSVCVGGDAGVRVCLPANIAGRASKAVGDRCIVDDECASGTCALARCAVRCTSDATCKTGMCTLSTGSLSEPRRWLCGDAVGREAGGSVCSMFDPTGCRSGLCTDRSACGKPCGRDTDCGADEACGFVSVRPIIVGPTAVLSVCQPRIGTEDTPLCCTNSDCGKSVLCAPKSLDNMQWAMGCR